jgi:hypothetical protein
MQPAINNEHEQTGRGIGEPKYGSLGMNVVTVPAGLRA